LSKCSTTAIIGSQLEKPAAIWKRDSAQRPSRSLDRGNAEGRESAMDFIERIFGISPDGGSGALELSLFLVPIIALYLLYRLRSRERKR
jgi:hypothetical protein